MSTEFSKLPQDFRVDRLFFDQGKTKDTYKPGFDILSHLFKLGASPNPHWEALNSIYRKTPYNSPGFIAQLIDDWYRQSKMPAPQKAMMVESVREILAAIEPYQKAFKTDEVVKQLSNQKYDRVELSKTIKTEKMNLQEIQIGKDRLRIFFPKNIAPQKLQKCIAKITEVWSALSTNEYSQTISVLLSPSNDHQHRSRCQTGEHPTMIISIHDIDYLDTVIHEMIHAALESKNKHPSREYAEGFATRLSLEFGASGKRDFITSRDDANKLSKYNNDLRSHTAFLETAVAGGEQLDTLLKEHYEYSLGYYTIDALLANSKFKQLEAEDARFGKNKFRIINFINDSFPVVMYELSAKGQNARSRDIIQAIFKEKLGFTNSEFDGYMHQINARISKDVKKESFRAEIVRIFRELGQNSVAQALSRMFLGRGQPNPTN